MSDLVLKAIKLGEIINMKNKNYEKARSASNCPVKLEMDLEVICRNIKIFA